VTAASSDGASDARVDETTGTGVDNYREQFAAAVDEAIRVHTRTHTQRGLISGRVRWYCVTATRDPSTLVFGLSPVARLSV